MLLSLVIPAPKRYAAAHLFKTYVLVIGSFKYSEFDLLQTNGYLDSTGQFTDKLVVDNDNQLSISSFVDSSGNIFVGDSKNFRVVKWEPGASEGSIVAGGNGQGNALNQLSWTYKVNVHSSGDIYIADEGNDRIVKWESGASQGVVVAGGDGSIGFGKGDQDDLTRIKMPRGVYVNEDREIYITTIVGDIHEGFIDEDNKIALYTDHQIFNRHHKFS